MYGLLFLFCFSTLCCAFSAYTIKPTGQIRDIIHDNFPDLAQVIPVYFSDIAIFLQLCFTASLISWTDFEDILFILVVVQLLRAICIRVTVLPNLKSYQAKRRFLGINGSGVEYIFSGHACYACITFIYLSKLGYFNRYLVFYNLVSQFAIVASRNHYTIDVLLAWILVPLIYTNFWLIFIR